MTHISGVLLEMLMRDGMSTGTAGTVEGAGMDAGMLEGTAHPLADAAHREEPRIRSGISGKGPGVNAPAKFTGLRVVVDNSRCKPIHPHTRVAPRGIGFHLVLIEGGRT